MYFIFIILFQTQRDVLHQNFPNLTSVYFKNIKLYGSLNKVKVKVKQYRYRPGVAQRVPGS